MAKRPLKQDFTADQFKELKKRLQRHAKDLAHKVSCVPAEPTFDDACEVRDHAQALVTTLNYLNNIDTCAELAQHKGTSQMFFDLAAIGLD